MKKKPITDFLGHSNTRMCFSGDVFYELYHGEYPLLVYVFLLFPSIFIANPKIQPNGSTLNFVSCFLPNFYLPSLAQLKDLEKWMAKGEDPEKMVLESSLLQAEPMNMRCCWTRRRVRGPTGLVFQGKKWAKKNAASTHSHWFAVVGGGHHPSRGVCPLKGFLIQGGMTTPNVRS